MSDKLRLWVCRDIDGDLLIMASVDAPQQDRNRAWDASSNTDFLGDQLGVDRPEDIEAMQSMLGIHLEPGEGPSFVAGRAAQREGRRQEQ